MKVNNQRRWPVALAIIAIVVIISLVIIFTNRISSADTLSFRAVSDGQGGAIALWQKGHQIYAQKMEPSGKLTWNKGGVLVNDRFTPSVMSWQFSIVADGQRGAVVTWDDRSGLVNGPNDLSYFSALPVYSQRLNANGEPLWGNGVPTGNTQSFGDYLTKPVSDSSGEALFIYNDFKVAYKALHDDYIYLQRISPEGKPLWGEKGILIYSSAPYHQVTPEEQSQGAKGTWTRAEVTRSGFSVASDGSGGAIVVWKEIKPADNDTVYAQHYDADGKPVWKGEGIPVYIAPSTNIQIVTSDGAGGIFITLSIGQSGSGARLIMQRVSPEGNLLWSSNGALVKENPRSWGDIQVISCGPGSPVISWQESLMGGPDAQNSLHAVRVSAEGKTMWQRDPLLVTEPGHIASGLSVCSDNESVFLTWRLSGEWANNQWAGTVMAQKMELEAGQSLWGEPGITVFNNSDLKYQGGPQIVSDSSGGIIILAVVGKNALQGDMVYAQRLDANGNSLWDKGIKISQ
jgi:hypothetical protein